MAATYHANGLRVIDQELIDEVVRTIVEHVHPRRIVLFGSHARGDAGPDSDLDLMVEMESDLPPLERRGMVRRLFDAELFPLDVAVYTPEEVGALRAQFGSLMSYIDREGRVLYERVPRDAGRLVPQSR